MDSNPLSIKCAKWYSNCWALWISTKWRKNLVKKSRSYFILS